MVQVVRNFALLRETLQNFLLPDSSLFGSSLHIPLLVMTFQKALLPYCLNTVLLNVAKWTYRITYQMKKPPHSSCPKEGLREPSVTWAVCPSWRLKMYVHLYFYRIQLQEFAFVLQKLTLQETKTCEYVWNTDTTAVNYPFPIVIGVSQGPGLTSKPYVTRLKSPDEEKEPKRNWMIKQGGGTS